MGATHAYHSFFGLIYLQAMLDGVCIGTIVGKIGIVKKRNRRRGYIAMLDVQTCHRKHGLGKRLVQILIQDMIRDQCDEVIVKHP
jgi:ribosomal protein S18 acetylase RimI-like enzyme